MGRLHADSPVPYCALCDGPCTHDFERGGAVFPDRLPRAADGSADPPPPAKPPKPNRRGKRAQKPAQNTAIRGPENDRMIHPTEDRSA